MKLSKTGSLDTSERKGLQMACTLQDVIDTLKSDQRDGMLLARGERQLKETASPSSARLLEAKALEKQRVVFKLSPMKRHTIIQRAARDFERTEGINLKDYQSVANLPVSVIKNIDNWLLSEYVNALISTDELTDDENNFLRYRNTLTCRVLVESTGYHMYRERFWQDISTAKEAWLFFNEFKVFLKQYWESRI